MFDVNELKIGDDVAVAGNGISLRYTFGKVCGVTLHTVKVKCDNVVRVFNKRNGLERARGNDFGLKRYLSEPEQARSSIARQAEYELLRAERYILRTGIRELAEGSIDARLSASLRKMADKVDVFVEEHA